LFILGRIVIYTYHSYLKSIKAGELKVLPMLRIATGKDYVDIGYMKVI